MNRCPIHLDQEANPHGYCDECWPKVQFNRLKMLKRAEEQKDLSGFPELLDFHNRTYPIRAALVAKGGR